MNLECVNEKMSVNKLVKSVIKEISIEEDIIIPDSKPDILSYVGACDNVCITKKEITNGNIKLEGTNDIYISYIPDSDVDILRCIDGCVKFNQSIDIEELEEDMYVKYFISIKNIECKILNGRKVRIKIILEVKLLIFSNNEIEILRDINNVKNIQSLVNNMDINAVVGIGNSKTIIKDNIKLPAEDDILEVIRIDYKVINKEYKISYNKVLGKGDLEVKVLYITQDNKINEVIGKIPIMEFVNIENISENNKIDLDFKMKNFNIKVNNQSDKNIYVESDIELAVIAYENKNVDIIKDLYIPNQNISYIENNIRAITNEAIIYKNCEINEKFKLDNIKEENIRNINIKYKNIDNTILNKKIELNGEIQTQVLAIDNEKKVINNIDNIPCKFEIDVPEKLYRTKNIEDYNIIASLKKYDVNFNSNSEKLNVDMNLDFEIDLGLIEKFKLLNDLQTVESSIVRPSYSLVIYFVKEGDTLWNIAKKFNTTINDILSVNDIKDENVIYPGQRLFIPKFVCKV